MGWWRKRARLVEARLLHSRTLIRRLWSIRSTIRARSCVGCLLIDLCLLLLMMLHTRLYDRRLLAVVDRDIVDHRLDDECTWSQLFHPDLLRIVWRCWLSILLAARLGPVPFKISSRCPVLSRPFKGGLQYTTAAGQLCRLAHSRPSYLADMDLYSSPGR